jgi:hypothetical protein
MMQLFFKLQLSLSLPLLVLSTKPTAKKLKRNRPKDLNGDRRKNDIDS